MKYYTLEEKLTKMTFKDLLDEIKETVIEHKGQEFYNKALYRYCHSMNITNIKENDEYSFLEFVLLLGRNNRIESNMEYLDLYGFKEE